MINALLEKIEYTIDDLMSADSNTFERHIKKLSRLLKSAEIKSISEELEALVDLTTWIDEGEGTHDIIVDRRRLTWPAEHLQELGMVVALTHWFADSLEHAIYVSITFYYTEDNYTSNLQNLASQIYSPFRRDFISYVKERISHSGDQANSPNESTSQFSTTPKTNKIFVVHGHDEAAKEKMARFLERIDLVPVILHEQASENKTVIEKIEKHSDVGFAVVLLTPDDEGGEKGKQQHPRARQNVILELGYFIGKLDRSRVAVLKRESVEVPSDISGVVYIPFDAHGAWKQKLGKELKRAGFQIDWNRVMNDS